MKKIAVVYWSGTGNTQAMASAVVDGVDETWAQAELIPCENFEASQLEAADAIAFGCPAMGAEVLEETVFEPMFTACEPLLKGKSIALFGSYGWGDGAWMRNWEQRCAAAGAVFICESVICADAPDDRTVALCKSMGAALAQ